MEMKLRSDMKPSVQCLYCLEMAGTDADHREISAVLRSCLTNRQYSVRGRLLYPSFHSAPVCISMLWTASRPQAQCISAHICIAVCGDGEEDVANPGGSGSAFSYRSILWNALGSSLPLPLSSFIPLHRCFFCFHIICPSSLWCGVVEMFRPCEMGILTDSSKELWRL